MRIINASDSQGDGTFLHAGYMSASAENAAGIDTFFTGLVLSVPVLLVLGTIYILIRNQLIRQGRKARLRLVAAVTLIIGLVAAIFIFTISASMIRASSHDDPDGIDLNLPQISESSEIAHAAGR